MANCEPGVYLLNANNLAALYVLIGVLILPLFKSLPIASFTQINCRIPVPEDKSTVLSTTLGVIVIEESLLVKSTRPLNEFNKYNSGSMVYEPAEVLFDEHIYFD